MYLYIYKKKFFYIFGILRFEVKKVTLRILKTAPILSCTAPCLVLKNREEIKIFSYRGGFYVQNIDPCITGRNDKKKKETIETETYVNRGDIESFND